MPVFEYRCQACGNTFEHWWRGSEKPEELKCPCCGATRVEKRVSACGLGKGASNTAGASCAPSRG